MFGWRSPGVMPETKDEISRAQAAAQMFDAEGAYFREQIDQAADPLLRDDGFAGRRSCLDRGKIPRLVGHPQRLRNVYTKDQLLTNVMIYLVTTQLQHGDMALSRPVRRSQRRAGAAKARVEKPVAIARFPVDLIPFPPSSQVERNVNVVRWTEFEHGGHFAALERPDDLLGDIRAFAREL